MVSGDCLVCKKTTEKTCPRCHRFSCADCPIGPNECCWECERDWAVEVKQIKELAAATRYNFPRTVPFGILLIFIGLWGIGGLLGLGFALLPGLLVVWSTRVALQFRERPTLKKAYKRFFKPVPPRAQIKK